MKIKEIRIGLVHIPLKKPFITALRRVEVAEDIIVQILSDSGESGFGNAPPTYKITGDGHGSVAGAIQDILTPALIGRDIDDLEDIWHVLDTSMQGNTSAKAAVDIAVYDLFGKQYGIPLYRLFGGRTSSLTSDLTISLNKPEEMMQDAIEAVHRGYTALKIKVGEDILLDKKRVRAVREAVGPNITLRLDANQAWKPKEAVRIIREWEDAGMDIELVEQPVRADDFDGLKFVTDHVMTDIMADEAAYTVRDVWRLLSMRACDMINIKLMKAGGLHNALDMAAMAKAAGVSCMAGCMLESKVGITAAASLMAGKRCMQLADLDAADLLAADPVRGGVSYNHSKLILPEAPGLGITGVEGVCCLEK
ncbi:dipeptide epimerase [Megasphaera paucivorans]|uniref:Dipeptide epimerase n=1 Tax=Megasphaera paucivorans TaxID=349095 RepID=A0A1G9YD04_9FIRM|nr:dipeptide epimerase [Megasphaera paucivorans]SDN06391.1 o-succinylbenzoate synthase [Megasphaera paucivorans]